MNRKTPAFRRQRDSGPDGSRIWSPASEKRIFLPTVSMAGILNVHLRKLAAPNSSAMDVVSFEQAKAFGLKRYFTGEPCVHGHIAARFVVNRRCIECALAYKASERGKEADRNYRRAYWHKPSGRQYQSGYNQTPKRKSAHNQHMREYNKTPLGKARVARANSERRVRNGGAEGSFTKEDFQKLVERQKKCHICGGLFTKTNPYTLDHVLALADGGSNDPSNLALAHKSCNAAKGAKRTHLI